MSDIIKLADKLSLFNETWTPKIIGQLNGQLVKLAKLEGKLTWHAHADEDELFLVLEGKLVIQLRDQHGHQSEVSLEQGDLYIVPKGVEHNPVASEGTSVLLFEPASTKHTGELIIDRTVTDQEWI